jgi:hypothetical protein
MATNTFVTKGDELSMVDPAIGASRIVGRVERIVPDAGYAIDVIRKPAGLVLAVHIPALILMYGEIRRLMRYYDSRWYRLQSYVLH